MMKWIIPAAIAVFVTGTAFAFYTHDCVEGKWYSGANSYFCPTPASGPAKTTPAHS